MVEIRIYGKLRRFAQDIPTDSDNVIRLSPEHDETLDGLLARLGIPVDEIYSIFYNSKLLAARSGMASMVGYRQVRSNPYNWDLNVAIKPADRLGLFGRDMAALVV
jgi:hypothetical protein